MQQWTSLIESCNLELKLLNQILAVISRKLIKLALIVFLKLRRALSEKLFVGSAAADPSIPGH